MGAGPHTNHTQALPLLCPYPRSARVLFVCQIDDFAVAAPSESIANILFDMIDDQLTFPPKLMGLVTLFDGLDITQTAD